MTRREGASLLSVLALGGLAACVAPASRPPAASPAPALALPPRVSVQVAGHVRSIDLEAYVLGTVLAEIGPAGERPDTVGRVFEVQAVLSRTYAVANLGRHGDEGFDLCDGTHCQVYRPGTIEVSRFAGAAAEAVDETRGRILAFAGRPAQSLFHADCGGVLASADAVWGGDPLPYLTGGRDDVPAGTHRQWTFEASSAALAAAFAADARSAAVGPRLSDVRVALRDASGRAAMVEVRGGDDAVVVRGEHLRAIINATFGVGAILSTRFDVERVGTGFRFTGTGHGHGVGLCQVGAIARARRGEPVETILTAYYPGAHLVAGVRMLARR